MIDVSSSQVLQKAFNLASKKFKKNVTLTDLTKIWKAVGQVVDDEMSSKRGIQIPKFGTFTFNAAGKPIFIISDIFSRNSRSKQTKVSLAGSRPKVKINISKLALLTSYPKRMIEDAIAAVVKAYAEVVNKGRGASVRLGFHPVAEITCTDMDVRVAYLTDFLARQGASKLNPRTLARLGTQPALSTFARDVMKGAAAVESSRASSTPRSVRETFSRTESVRSLVSPASSRASYRTPTRAGNGSSKNPVVGSRATPTRSGTRTSGRMTKKPGSNRSGRYSVAGSPAKRSVGTPRSGQNAALSAHGKGIVEKVKETIIRRGGSHGIHAISRVLKIMDDSGDKKLSRDELKYGLRDYGIDLNNKQLSAVVAYFDKNGDGTVDLDEFIIGLAPPMDERRLKLVNAAYDLLDRNGDGRVTIEDMKMNYDPSHHEDVKSGKIKSDEWLLQYLAEFETIEKDGIVTREEFTQYYQNLSASIDNADFFELMMRNAWHMSGGSGWCANTTNRRVVVTGKDGKQTIKELKNDLWIRKDDEAAIRKNLEDQGVDVSKVELYAKMDDDQAFGKKNDQFKSKRARPTAAKGRSRSRPSNDAPRAPQAAAKRLASAPPPPPEDDDWQRLRRILYTPPINLPGLMQKLEVNMSCGSDKIFKSTFAMRLKYLDRKISPKLSRQLAETAALGQKEVDVSDLHDHMVNRFGTRGAGTAGKASATGGCKPVGSSSNIVDKVRKKIIARAGGHAIHSLYRVLKIMDDDGNKKLSKDELKFGLKDYGVELTSTELDNCMTTFDQDRDGTVSFDEFVLAMAPPMNERRLKFVNLAFDMLDRNGDGTCTLDDLKYNYDAEHHPSVKTGKVKSDEYLAEFLSQFDTIEKDGIVTREEFHQYYQNLAASIDGDDYFELMMRNAWHISGGTGWCANTTNRRVLVTGKDGKQSTQEVKNDLFIRKDDEDAMKTNLKDQGLDVEKMDLYAEMEEDNAFGGKKDVFKNKPDRPRGVQGKSRKSKERRRPEAARRTRPSRNGTGADRSKKEKPDKRKRSKQRSSRNKDKDRKDDPLKAFRRKGDNFDSMSDMVSRRLLRARAVTRLQNMFRAFKARKAVEYKKRCLASKKRRKEEAEAERAKEAARMKRPTGSNRGGFYNKR
jgi:Ca2+-binding EF-hand superfamily protein